MRQEYLLRHCLLMMTAGIVICRIIGNPSVFYPIPTEVFMGCHICSGPACSGGLLCIDCSARTGKCHHCGIIPASVNGLCRNCSIDVS